MLFSKSDFHDARTNFGNGFFLSDLLLVCYGVLVCTIFIFFIFFWFSPVFVFTNENLVNLGNLP